MEGSATGSIFAPELYGRSPGREYPILSVRPEECLSGEDARWQAGFHRDLLTWARAASATRSTVKPNSTSRSLSGADAPNDRMPMLAPCSPTYLVQPKVEACSTETRFLIQGGSTWSR